MTNFDIRTLVPTDMPEIQLLMWTYADEDAGMVGYGTVSALAQAYSDADHYGDGESLCPGDVWVMTSRGPIRAFVRRVSEDGLWIKVSVRWLTRQPGVSGSTVTRLSARYEILDI